MRSGLFLALLPISLLGTTLPGGITVFTDQAPFMSAVAYAGDFVQDATSYQPAGYPERVIANTYLAVYERDEPAVGTFDCGTDEYQPFCLENGLYGKVTPDSVWEDHIFSKSPSDPTIIDNIQGATTEIFFPSHDVGAGAEVSLGLSASPVAVTLQFGNSSDSLSLPAGYHGFLGVMTPNGSSLLRMDFQSEDPAGANIAMSDILSVQYAPEPSSITLLGIGLLAGITCFMATRRQGVRAAENPIPSCSLDVRVFLQVMGSSLLDLNGMRDYVFRASSRRRSPCR